MKTRANTIVVIAVAVGVTPVPAFAQDPGQPGPAALKKLANKKPGYSPYAGRDFPTRPFFGDTHVQTATSFDAGAFGTKPMPGTPMVVPERAYTSPIWYTP